MIRAVLYDRGKPIVVLGLSEENMVRLHAGQPVQVNLKHLDPNGPPTDLPDIEVVIAFDDGGLAPQLMNLGEARPINSDSRAQRRVWPS